MLVSHVSRTLMLKLLVLFAGSCACAVYTYSYFADAFPITALSITADQYAVRASARALHSTDLNNVIVRPVHDWREASSFKLDSACQHFVELRGGGNPAFAQLLSDGIYSPFTWRVRHFQPGDAAETLFFFKPDGSLNGFSTTLPEDEIAANLTSEAALKLATATAAQPPWRIDFDVWKVCSLCLPC